MFFVRLQELCNNKGINVTNLALELGISRSNVTNWKNGSIPKSDKIQKIAEYFNVSADYLLGDTDTMQPKGKGIRIPVLGEVQAGLPIEAIEDIIDYEEIDPKLARTGEFFALQVRGDSMEPKFSQGDVVIVKQQCTVDSGDIAIILVNGDSATIKKFVRHENGVSLIASNPSYLPMFYTNEEVEELPIVCLGKVIELRAKF